MNATPTSTTPYWKIGLSVILVVHLLAVTAEPLRFFTRSSRGTSPVTDPVRMGLAPYVEFGYLNHGYFFFAPEPGPSHLLECRLSFGESEEGMLRFPDKQAQWPRLLYHRHFMLAEFLHQLHAPPVQAELVDDAPQLLADWRADRQRFEMVRDSYARHLMHRYGADAAKVARVEHRLPSNVEVLEQKLPLNDPTLYVVLPDAPPLIPELPVEQVLELSKPLGNSPAPLQSQVIPSGDEAQP
ncbi:MAG: hypothetical protein R3C53_20480 [Pirellulaceae bacterium]